VSPFLIWEPLYLPPEDHVDKFKLPKWKEVGAFVPTGIPMNFLSVESASISSSAKVDGSWSVRFE
jgi:hypothetical protein